MSELERPYNKRYNSSSVSVISADSKYIGDVEFEGVLHINGDFFGNIRGKGDLGIGDTGRVKSMIYAHNVLISGLVYGDIIALGRVSLKSSAIVVGNIRAESLVVEEGALIEGKLETVDVSGVKNKLIKTKQLPYIKKGSFDASFGNPAMDSEGLIYREGAARDIKEGYTTVSETQQTTVIESENLVRIVHGEETLPVSQNGYFNQEKKTFKKSSKKK